MYFITVLFIFWRLERSVSDSDRSKTEGAFMKFLQSWLER